jgi:cobalt/nickel transport protein
MTHQPTPRTGRGGSRTATWLLIAAVILLIVIPFLLNPKSEFTGADDAASSAIAEIAPAAHPWFEPIWSPPGAETQSLLFALQAALGAGVIGYFFGVKRGQRRSDRSGKQ